MNKKRVLAMLLAGAMALSMTACGGGSASSGDGSSNDGGASASGGSYKVSVRTAGEIDACKICAALGGGGHMRAAGCEFFGNLENAKAAVLAEVEKQI